MNRFHPTLLTIVCAFPVAACDSSHAEKAATKAAASASPSTEVEKSPPEPPPPPPADINAKSLVERLDCPKHARQGACRVVEGFAGAGSLNWKRPAGKARWVGYKYSVEKGKEKRELIILFAKEIPTEQAGVGAMPLRIGTGNFPERLMAHARRMVSARSRHHGPSPRNQAPRFLSDFEPEKDWTAIQTDGSSILTVEANPAYIREHQRTVYYVKPDDSNPARPGDGTYAELWLATW